MSFQIFVNNNEVHYQKIVFSDGASLVRMNDIKPFEKAKSVLIKMNCDMNMDSVLWDLMQILAAVENSCLNIGSVPKISVYLPYLPHGRADRPFTETDSFPLDLFLFLLSKEWCMGELIVDDPHNEKALSVALPGTVELTVNSHKNCFINTVPNEVLDREGVLFIAPDKGAREKTGSVASVFQKKLVSVDKKRDAETGKILSIDVPEQSYDGKVAFITDDICDGGGTFIPIARQLKEYGAEEVYLYVTHGIFSKGLKMFEGTIDKIFAYNIIGDYITRNDIATFNNK